MDKFAHRMSSLGDVSSNIDPVHGAAHVMQTKFDKRWNTEPIRWPNHVRHFALFVDLSG